MRIQKSKNKIRNKIKFRNNTTKNHTRKSPKYGPKKHKNYDPKLGQDQAEKSQIPQKSHEKRVKTGSKHATNQTKKLRKIQK